MSRMLANLTLLGVFLGGAFEAYAQFPSFEIPSTRRQLPRALPPIPPTEALSDRPTINCSNLRNSVAQILCVGREGAAADWAVNAAIWAYLNQIGDTGKTTFEAEQTGWRNSIASRCSLPSLFNPATVEKREISCVVGMFHERARQIRSRLQPEALAEVNLTPEQRASIQQRLIDDGFLSGTADGEFGLQTREAIKRYQLSQGIEQTGFASQSLLNTSSTARQTSPVQSQGRLDLVEQQRVEAELKKRLSEANAQREAIESKLTQMTREFQSETRAARALSEKQSAELESSRKALNDAMTTLQAREQQIGQLQSSTSQTQSTYLFLIIGLSIFSTAVAIAAALLYRRVNKQSNSFENASGLHSAIDMAKASTENNHSPAWLYKKVPLRVIVAVSIICGAFVAYREYADESEALSCSLPWVLNVVRENILKQLGLNDAALRDALNLGDDITTDRADRDIGTLWCSTSFQFDLSAAGKSLSEDERSKEAGLKSKTWRRHFGRDSRGTETSAKALTIQASADREWTGSDHSVPSKMGLERA